MKRAWLALLAVMIATPAFSEERSSRSTVIPERIGPIAAARIASVTYGKVAVSSHEEGLCGVEAEGDLSRCRTVTEYADRVRVSIVYDVLAGADPGADLPPYAGEVRTRTLRTYVDFAPAELPAPVLAALRTPGGPGLFGLAVARTSYRTRVVDPERSLRCTPDMLACRDSLLYRTHAGSLVTMTVSYPREQTKERL